MFTYSDELLHKNAQRVCRVLGSRLGIEPPENLREPWEVMVDGYLPVELHFSRRKVLFVGVVQDVGNPAEQGDLLDRALEASRETLGSGEVSVCLESANGRLLVWTTANDEASDGELEQQFTRFLKEFDLWYGKLVAPPGGARSRAPQPCTIFG